MDMNRWTEPRYYVMRDLEQDPLIEDYAPRRWYMTEAAACDEAERRGLINPGQRIMVVRLVAIFCNPIHSSYWYDTTDFR